MQVENRQDNSSPPVSSSLWVRERYCRKGSAVSNWLPNELYWQTLFCGGLSVSQGTWLTLKGWALLALSLLLRTVIHPYRCCRATVWTYGNFLLGSLKKTDAFAKRNHNDRNCKFNIQ